MKNSIFTFVIVLVAQMGFASELDSILNKARALSNNKEYTEAIIVYENYIKVSKGENLKEVYIEIANCYFYQGKKQEAVNNIKTAIVKCGFLKLFACAKSNKVGRISVAVVKVSSQTKS